MNGVQELKRQAVAAKQAVAPKKQNKKKQHLVKWQTGKYTYRYVTLAQAKYWGSLRSADKKKKFREIRKQKIKIVNDNRAEIKKLKERIRRDKRAIEKLENRLEGWTIKWDDIPEELKSEVWRVHGSDSWLVKRLFSDDDEESVTIGGMSGDAEVGTLDVFKLFMRATTEDYSDTAGEVANDVEALMIIFEEFPDKAQSFFGNTAKGSAEDIRRKLTWWTGLREESRERVAVRRQMMPPTDPDEEERMRMRKERLECLVDRMQARIDALRVTSDQVRAIAKSKQSYGKKKTKLAQIEAGRVYSFAPGEFNAF